MPVPLEHFSTILKPFVSALLSFAYLAGRSNRYNSYVSAPFFIYFLLSENPAYRRASDGVVLGPQYRHGSLYSDSFPYGAPPRPPQGKGGSMNGQVNPALSMDDDVITMNPLYEGQVVDHRDLDELNCSDFAVYPEQIVLEDRKNPYGEGNFQSFRIILILNIKLFILMFILMLIAQVNGT